MYLDPLFTLGICAAGGIGAVLRLLLGRWRGKLPWGTLTANLAAGLVIGLAIFGQNRALVENWVVILAFTGLAGGLSTFSGVAAETGEFIRSRKWALAAANLGANLFLPVLTVWLPVAALGLLVN